MVTKYARVRVPYKAYENFKAKQIKMEAVAKKLMGKNRRIPLTKVISIVSESPTYLEDHDFISKVKRRKI